MSEQEPEEPEETEEPMYFEREDDLLTWFTGIWEGIFGSQEQD